MVWVLGALCVGAAILVLAAYRLTLGEIDEVLDESLRQTALLLADRDLAHALPAEPALPSVASSDTESMLVAMARSPDGRLLFSSQPELPLRFAATPGASVQTANARLWHVFTIVQSDRIIQVAQPTSVRREDAAESASQLLAPLLVLILLIGALLVVALRRGLRPLAMVNAALAERSASSLAPLDLRDVPTEVLPLVHTLNDLLQRLSAAFDLQRHFAADAAHELRSPVTALQLQVQLLARSSCEAERTAATAELAAGIRRVRRLIEQLLSLSHAEADETSAGPSARRPVRLGDLARAAVVRWSVDAERRGIDLGADADDSVAVEGDAGQLEILLGNLVENAIRYTPAGGVVDVVAGLIHGAPTLKVVDNGPGIVEAERARVFDRFYRSPRALAGAEAGSGLGLAIVKTIADRHGATVTLQAGPEGTGFVVKVVFASTA